MLIRPAEISDTKKIAATHRASIEVICSRSYNSQSISGWIEILSPVIYEDAIEHKIMILAEEDEEILGLGILDLEQKEIGAIYIHPKAEGTGCGRKLLLKLESIALKNKVYQLALCSTINAFGFYQYNGYISLYKTFHELPNAIKLDCYKMTKNLQNNDSV
jgi:putative acetyltransferase